MTLLVRDEIDIIEDNLSFHFAQGVDHAIVIDNGSVDGTREFLASLENQGRVTVLDEPEQNYQQGIWMTRAALLARDEFGADWVINNDADEFWVPGHGDLKTILAETEADVLSCRRRNMVFAWDSPTGGCWLERCVFSVTSPAEVPRLQNVLSDPLPCPYFYLDLPDKLLTRTKGLVEITQGNHSARYNRDFEITGADIEILHFPVRSKEQFSSKTRNGGLAYSRNLALDKRVGWHVRRQFQMIETQGLDAAIADALPDIASLEQDLEKGKVFEYLGLKERLSL